MPRFRTTMFLDNAATMRLTAQILERDLLPSRIPLIETVSPLDLETLCRKTDLRFAVTDRARKIAS